MKISNYNISFELDNNNHILYNTLSKNYSIYSKSEKEHIDSLLSTLNRSEFDEDEFIIIQDLYEKKFIIDNDFDGATRCNMKSIA